MKKILWCAAVLTAVILTGCWKTPQRKRVDSICNLKRIYLAAESYRMNHNDECPPDLNTLFKCHTERGDEGDIFISPSDPLSRAVAKDDMREENTSYAYVGKGVNTRGGDLPIAFEKANIVSATGYCCVLYCDGHVKVVQMTAKSNREIAEKLTAHIAPGFAVYAQKNLIIANAAEVDAREAKVANRK